MIGVGITMEGINQNEIMYEFALEQSWRSPLNQTELDDWYFLFKFSIFFCKKILPNRLVDFVLHRYTHDLPVPSSLIHAWQLLGRSVYQNNVYGDGSIMLYRPRLNREQSVSF